MAREVFTVGRVARHSCPPDQQQAFLWDERVPGLALRTTRHGAKAFIFQSRLLNGSSVRMTIGDPASWPIPQARAEARRLQGIIDRGADPRAEKAATVARHAQERADAKAERQRQEVTGLDAWKAYCADRAPHWGELHGADHDAMVQAGGQPRARSRVKTTKAGPLRSLLSRPLATIDVAAVEAWIERETKTRPTSAARGFRLLRAFVNWCAESDDYSTIVCAGACTAKRVREKVARPGARTDALQREQLAAWFAEVRKDSNPVAGAFLQALLLTGARREELMRLRWTEVDFQWKALRIRDKVDGERTIPLTPYVAQVLSFLPRRNQWVFSSPTSEDGRLQEPRPNHQRALVAAGLPHLTLHGLRRSFGTLSEWVECPVGIVAQIQGHKPSAIAEKHYRVRPLDLLRMWHERIETWILNEAGIEQPTAEQAGALRVVGGTEAR